MEGERGRQSRQTHLRDIRPRQRTPAELVHGVRDEDHGDRGDAGAARPLRRWRRRRLADDRDDGEADGHDERRAPERRLAVPALREAEDVDAAGDEFLRAEQARDQEGALLVVAREELEDLRAEVRQGGLVVLWSAWPPFLTSRPIPVVLGNASDSPSRCTAGRGT